MDPPPPIRFIDAQEPAAPCGAPTFACMEIVARIPRVDVRTMAQRCRDGNARGGPARIDNRTKRPHGVAASS
jgi:hypothetical protein